jgi:hypothetical protein
VPALRMLFQEDMGQTTAAQSCGRLPRKLDGDHAIIVAMNQVDSNLFGRL